MKRKNKIIIIIGLVVSLQVLLCLICIAYLQVLHNQKPMEEELQEQMQESREEEQQEQMQKSREKQQEQMQESREEEQQEQTQESREEEQQEQTQDSRNQSMDLGGGDVKESGERLQKKSQEEILEQQIQDKLESMTIEEKVAQLFIITPEALTGYSKVTQAGDTTREAFGEYPVGGFIFFEGNLLSEEQVTEMIEKQQEYSQGRIGLPLFVSIDEEGGQVTRIAAKGRFDVPSFPDISKIGTGQDTSQAYEMGNSIGTYLERMGFNLDFAPVADVLSNPDNTVVKRRSYGSDARNVSQMVLENLKGLQQHCVYGCIKHFPGHGVTQGDTHEGYAYTDKTWEELSGNDIIPFKDSIDWGVEFIMVGHISLPGVTGDDVPASLSPYVISNLLRQELGYDGIVLTDALNMGAITRQYTSSQAAVKAILAGNDMVLMPSDFKSAYAGILDAVQDGTITKERLNDSLTRILRMKMLMAES